MVKALLEYDAQADAFCADGETALMQAAWAGHISVLKLLIDKGAAVNAVTPSGISALHQGIVITLIVVQQPGHSQESILYVN